MRTSVDRDRQRPGRPRDRDLDMSILDATERLLGRRGYEAMTMEQVADAAGVSKPTIYLRYRSKQQLVGAMIDRLRPPLPNDPTGPAGADLAALIEMQRQWIERHGLGIVAAVLLEQVDHPELMRRFQERVVEPVRDAFGAVLRAGIDRHELRPGADAGEVIDALTGAYWSRTWASDGDTSDWTERLISALIAGLKRPVDAGTVTPT